MGQMRLTEAMLIEEFGVQIAELAKQRRRNEVLRKEMAIEETESKEAIANKGLVVPAADVDRETVKVQPQGESL